MLKGGRKSFRKPIEQFFDHTIVDDMLCTAETLDHLKQIVKQVTEFFTLCSMNVHKWASNSKRLMLAIPKESRAKQVVIQKIDSENPDLQPVIKTLGMVYEPSRDVFRFSFEFESPKKWTHRVAASMVASLYDPEGFVSPFVVKGRLLNQRMFAHKIGWDDYVGKRLEEQCKKWLKECEDLTHVEIPRKLSNHCHIDEKRHKVYVFCDASFDAYGACAYLCVDNQSGLLGSRTRVAPLAKRESIGRLELAACVEGVELGFRVTQALKTNITNVKFYTDSTNALLWMRTNKKISVFAASRVCKIKDRTNIEQWKHVQTNDNPADILSRGMTPQKLASCQLWWHGPSFLIEGQEPVQPDIVETLEARQELVEENRIMMQSSVSSQNAIDVSEKLETDLFNKYASFEQFLKIWSKIHYCIKFWRSKQKSSVKLQEAQYRDEVEKRLQVKYIKQVQKAQLSDLRKALLSSNPVPKQYLSLRPFLDNDGILRVNGRLRQAMWLDYDQRHPIILPKKGKLTHSLIVAHHRQKLRHAGGVEVLLNSMQKKYWIIQGRVLCRKVIQDCNHCQLRHQKWVRPEMAPVHPSRLDVMEMRAFNTIGVDMAGPLLVKNEPGTRKHPRTELKRYFIIFSCCTTRAVHFELVDSADAESFLMSLERFVSHYGVPTKILSDSGGNFVKANKELQQISEEWSNTKVQIRNKYPGIKWQFAPPYSPNWGGHFERLIGVAKVALNDLLQSRKQLLTHEQLRTLLAMVKGILNSRPLTASRSHPEDPVPLTPDHFLKSGAPTYLYGTPQHDKEQLGKRYRCLLDILNQYWKRFLENYIPTLHRVEKWQRGSKDMKVGQVVMVLEPGIGRGEWPLGRIIAVYLGSDGRVRSADVETVTLEVGHRSNDVGPAIKTVKKRSVSTLSPLEFA